MKSCTICNQKQNQSFIICKKCIKKYSIIERLKFFSDFEKSKPKGLGNKLHLNKK